MLRIWALQPNWSCLWKVIYLWNHFHVADGVCVQSLEHPGCVWDVKFLENGDIVTACSDGVVRIWTSHQERIADPVDLDSYVSQLSQYKLSRYIHALFASKWYIFMHFLLLKCGLLYCLGSMFNEFLLLFVRYVSYLMGNCELWTTMIYLLTYSLSLSLLTVKHQKD
jgi:hypothetical protein